MNDFRKNQCIYINGNRNLMRMLSYMMPVEDKPPPVPGKSRLALELLHAPRSPDPDSSARQKPTISKDSSSSSFASDLTVSSSTPTTHDKPKHKLLANGNKHTALKRVSFGSSKGSMVETLIYESPLEEEPESTPPPRDHETSFPFSTPPPPIEEDSERSKVRVSFFVGAETQCVSPPPATSPLGPVPIFASSEIMADHHGYNRQVSTESGWDNPFRPDGDLSREADEIVSLIKGGKPITPTPHAEPLLAVDEVDDKMHATQLSAEESSPQATSPQKNMNGTKKGGAAVEVQRSPEPQQAEHVTIKKKPKCECCVLQ